MNADFLRSQHRQILDQAGAIRERTRQPVHIDAYVAEDLRHNLGELSASVSLHLATEDHVLYPRLMKGSNPKTRAAAKQLHAEVGGIAEAFKEYLLHWRSGKAILRDPTRFARETDEILTALAARIEREEHELYPLLESH